MTPAETHAVGMAAVNAFVEMVDAFPDYPYTVLVDGHIDATIEYAGNNRYGPWVQVLDSNGAVMEIHPARIAFVSHLPDGGSEPTGGYRDRETAAYHLHNAGVHAAD